MDDNDLYPEHPAFELMRCGVPLSLLIDLAMPVDSASICRDEPADLSWVHAGTG